MRRIRRYCVSASAGCGKGFCRPRMAQCRHGEADDRRAAPEWRRRPRYPAARRPAGRRRPAPGSTGRVKAVTPLASLRIRASARRAAAAKAEDQRRGGQVGHHQEGARAPGRAGIKKKHAQIARPLPAAARGAGCGQSRGYKLRVMATMPIRTSDAQAKPAFRLAPPPPAAQASGQRPPASGRCRPGASAPGTATAACCGWLRRAGRAGGPGRHGARWQRTFAAGRGIEGRPAAFHVGEGHASPLHEQSRQLRITPLTMY